MCICIYKIMLLDSMCLLKKKIILCVYIWMWYFYVGDYVWIFVELVIVFYLYVIFLYIMGMFIVCGLIIWGK